MCQVMRAHGYGTIGGKKIPTVDIAYLPALRCLLDAMKLWANAIDRSNGDPRWSAGPPTQDNILMISKIEMYYNTTTSAGTC